MLKIINVVQDFNMGGIQRVLISLLRAFKNDPDVDYSVAVLENAKGSEFDNIVKEERLNVVYLGCKMPKCGYPHIKKILRDLSYDGRLLLYLLKQKPDIVHTHNTRMLTLVLKCIKWTRKKYVWVHTLHSDPYAVHEGHIPRIQKAVNQYGVHAICLNETQFEKAKERYGIDKCRYIYNMVELDKYHNTRVTRNKCRENLGIPEDAYVIGTVGRLDAVKNYKFLLKSFCAASVMNEKAVLVFTGDGDEAADLKKYADDMNISDKVFFLGARKNTEEIYPAFDVFALTSISESSSLVVLEAQATGLTCVVSSACPKESVISDNVVIMDKSASDEEWAKQLLNPTNFSERYAFESDYGEENVKRELKRLYFDLASLKGKNE